MPPRFFVPGQYRTGDRIALPDDEAEHLTRVLRLRAGDPVRVFDGRGQEFEGAVAMASKNAATVDVGAPREAVPEPRLALTVAQAVLKGDKMDSVVRDAVMLGATAIQPIVTARTEVALATLQRGHRSERWNRVAVSSAKQCGRSVVPWVLEPMSFDALVDGLRQVTLPQPALTLVEPSTGTGVVPITELDSAVPREATVVIGPEGGWTADEIGQLAAVSRLVRLGGRTLRADATATVAIAALFTWWKEF